MLRRMMKAALAVAVIGLSAPQAAEARGFGHGGWGHGGGWGHRGHWHGGGFWPGVAIGAGVAGAGLYSGYYGYGYGYPYYAVPDDYGPAYNDGYGGCYVARKRVMTPSGWRYRRVDVCE
ncbi:MULTISPECIES: hypothetical protein [Bradyrhizobium]|uniref:hypothetical protein n=1 Tax=Bradyrhizobium TaxID=374 RepID=UPI00155E46BB|nr:MULTISPECIES: hypothetical protein [Bradyrhizobium]MDD1516330.1 hypothetical protein [Bradyrhizobium sp. WBAH30]MDD1546953.1 hypothetical protein [Bradyrhizobium sp. WBAH41]MDD1554234.1 hypothetical protein [Bradyrhizobium sp. WBAH23]MDD1562185.1 hypothetical protein [Bradyrhizobium sp. WBAH33]MDD1591720.1 hypothetical protein [Bradyrhizobium sp. WBAH42]